MNKAHRCYLHLACIAVKLFQGRDVSWHWQHLLREFGFHSPLDDAVSGAPKIKKFHVIPHH